MCGLAARSAELARDRLVERQRPFSQSHGERLTVYVRPFCMLPSFSIWSQSHIPLPDPRHSFREHHAAGLTNECDGDAPAAGRDAE